MRFPLTRPQLCAAPLVLLAWCGVVFFYGLDAGPLYRTESLRAIIGAECLRGHWLYPVLYGEPFLTKPPGHYAAIGLCSLPFGQVTAASARLPSALAATAAVFLVHGLFRRSLGERAAVIAALLLPMSILWLDKAPSAEIDMTLVGWVTAALVLFERSLQAPGRFSLGWLVLALVCVALGTLTKWTAPAFFYLCVIPLLAWRGQLRLLLGGRHLLAAGVAAAILAAWVLAVAQQVGWDALANTIRGEVVYRFNPPPKAHGYPWTSVLSYPFVVLAAHLPLSLFALRTLRPSFYHRFDERGKRLLQLLHCWAWPSLLFWSLVPNHNVRYALPMSPGLMGLGVVGLLAWRSRPDLLPSQGSRLGIRFLLGCLAAWLILKVVFVEVVVPQRTAGRDAEVTAARLRELVPEGETLYVLRLKDEGVMFYYGRPVRKVHDPAAVPRPAFVVLIGQEWDNRAMFGGVTLVQWMYDQQGDPLVLIETKPGPLVATGGR